MPHSAELRHTTSPTWYAHTATHSASRSFRVISHASRAREASIGCPGVSNRADHGRDFGQSTTSQVRIRTYPTARRAVSQRDRRGPPIDDRTHPRVRSFDYRPSPPEGSVISLHLWATGSFAPIRTTRQVHEGRPGERLGPGLGAGLYRADPGIIREAKPLHHFGLASCFCLGTFFAAAPKHFIGYSTGQGDLARYP